MAEPQIENGHIRIANEIWDEIIRRDFTKRQKDILQFVIRLSYGCNKKSAHVPMMQDFGLCGVTKNHIKEELIYLRSMKVLNWTQEEMVFSFNKNYDIWQARPVRKWDDGRFKELVHINLSSSQNRNQNNEPVPKTGTNQFPKQESEGLEIPCGTKDEDGSKDSIKYTQVEEEETGEPRTILGAFNFSFKKGFMNGHMSGYVQRLLARGLTESFIVEVLLEMGERGANPDSRYMEKLAEDWISKGIYTRVEGRRRKESATGHPSDKQASADLRLAEERKNLAPQLYAPDDSMKEVAAGYGTGATRPTGTI